MRIQIITTLISIFMIFDSEIHNKQDLGLKDFNNMTKSEDQLSLSKENASTIVIVGSGLAGLSAAIEAFILYRDKIKVPSSSSFGLKEQNSIIDQRAEDEINQSFRNARKKLSILILEKENQIGGNSMKATSGINGLSMNNKDDKKDIESFYLDTLKSGGGISDERLVRVLVESSSDALQFLESFGIQLNSVSQCGGHSVPRTYKEQPRSNGKPAPIGFDIIKALKAFIVESNQDTTSAWTDKDNDHHESLKLAPSSVIQVLYNSKFSGLTTETMEGQKTVVKGVKYIHNNQEKIIDASAVILATGGFSHDFDFLIKQHVPWFQNLSTTNGPWATGDGMKIAAENGANLIHMDKVQLHPTGFVDPREPQSKVKFLAPEALRAHGGLLIDPLSGRRFVNELDTRDRVSSAIQNLSAPLSTSSSSEIGSGGQNKEILNHEAWLVFNQHVVDSFGKPSIDFYIFKGLVHICKDLIELSEFCSIPIGTLRNTFTEYSERAKSGLDEFGRTTFSTLGYGNGPFYVAKITPTIHYTMGGIQINENTQVIGRNGMPIFNFYAAGEVTGGVHGQNRLAGNSLIECVVFGRIAGRNAVKSIYFSE